MWLLFGKKYADEWFDMAITPPIGFIRLSGGGTEK